MQMDPAVRTIAISCATAIIGYISSSLLNMRAARPMSHMRRQLWRHGQRWAAWRHRTRRHRRGASARDCSSGATASPEPTLAPTPRTKHRPQGPALSERARSHVHRTCTRAHEHRMRTQAQQHLGRVERVYEQVTHARVGDTNPTRTRTPNQLKELFGPLLA